MLVIRLEAERHDITPSAITSKKQVVDMLEEGRTSLSEDWRGELVNDAIAKVLEKQTVLGVNDGKAQLLDWPA
jgi:ribonuclease D